MRPRTLDEYVGQEHLLGPGKLLRRAIEADRLYSALFYGPPGTGKTSLAEVIARATQARFERLSGVESTVADIRRVIAIAANRLQGNPHARTILFIDEIHRFNRAQQDALLPDVERGTVRLLGATTENPFFRGERPAGQPLADFPARTAAAGGSAPVAGEAPCKTPSAAWANTASTWQEAAAEHLATISDGDARKCLNALEVGVLTTEPGPDGVIQFTREPSPKRASNAKPLFTIPLATATTTRSAPSSRACAARTRTRLSIGWRRCSTRARTSGSSRGGW